MCGCHKFVALFALLASGNHCLKLHDSSLHLHENTDPKPRIILCGYEDTTRFIQASVFPDLATLDQRKNAGKHDIMLASGDCNYRAFPGKVVYLEGEYGTNLQLHPRLYLLSGSRSSNLNHVPLQGWTQVFYVAHATLFHPFTAADFLKRRNGEALGENSTKNKLPLQDRGFMIYVSSRCFAHRDGAFDAIVKLARDKLQKVPVAKGQCHGSHPETSQWEQDRDKPLREITNVEHMRNFRFTLCMENTNTEGYISEKIAAAFGAGTIPIWYGTREVFKLFNADAFVYYDVDRPQPALEEIARLENNMTAYEEKLQQPIFANGRKSLEDFFSLDDALGDGKLKNRIREMLRV